MNANAQANGNVLPLPDAASAKMIVPPPEAGVGNWAGAPSVAYADGTYYLAYRLRQPVTAGRGFAVAIAASADGESFETLSTLSRDDFGAASLERPALVAGPDGRWLLYVSCATPGNDHWWVDVLEADHPAKFDPSSRRTTLPGDETVAVKDPVVVCDGSDYLLWACLHPLDDPDSTDRMTTQFASSADGIKWDFDGPQLRGRAGSWDQRGFRVAHVERVEGGWGAYYDGRASKADNAEELTGLAFGETPNILRSLSDQPACVSPWGTGSLRYLSAVRTEEGIRRLYFEACLQDGSHGLFTQVVTPTR